MQQDPTILDRLAGRDRSVADALARQSWTER